MELGQWLVKRMISAIIVEHYFPHTLRHSCAVMLLVPFPRVLECYFGPLMDLGQRVKQIHSKVNRMCTLGSSWSSEASSHFFI